VHANHMQYKLLGAFAELNATGSAQSWGADLLVPLIRQPQRNLSLQVTTDHKNFENLALANAQAASTSTVSNYTLDVVRAGISGNWRDPLSATAQNTANVQVSWGQLDLSRSPNATADAAAANTAGAFRKWSVNFNREQALTVQSTWYIQTAAQWANRNLDSSEKLYLGGASGVRAYPSNEAGGTLGGTVTTGIRHRLTDTLTLNGFTDWGRIRVYQRNTNASGNDITSLNTQSLQGTGLTLLWRGQQGQELSATWSRRIGSNPAAQPSTGADSDGTLKLNRLWLSAMLNF
jgi:hemolysin activation/secretion protein